MAWAVKPLGEICDILDSRRKPITKKDRVPGPYPYYGATGQLDSVHSYLFDEPLVLVGEDGAKWGAGEKSAYDISGKCWVNNHAHVLRPHRSILDDRWLIYWLNASDLMAYITGLTVPKLNQARLREIPVPLPPLPEQRRVVAVLDEAFAGLEVMRANAEKNLKNVRELFEQAIEHVFDNESDGWAEVTFDSIAAIKGGKRVPKGYKLLTEKTAYPYLRVTDFTDSGTVDTSDLRYLDSSVHEEIKRYIIRKEDLYVSIAGTIGKTGIIPKELDGAHLTENACRLVFSPEVHNSFVYYFTRTRDFVRQAGLNTRTTAQPKLALSRLATVKLRIPPKADQLEWVAKFKLLEGAASALEFKYTQKLAAIVTLRRSILHMAFSGELTSTESIAA